MAAKRKDKDMKDVMEETVAQDVADGKTKQAAGHIKDAHLYSKELEIRLRTCRLETTDLASNEHDLNRVVDLCGEVKAQAKKALDKLPL